MVPGRIRVRPCGCCVGRKVVLDRQGSIVRDDAGLPERPRRGVRQELPLHSGVGASVVAKGSLAFASRHVVSGLQSRGSLCECCLRPNLLAAETRSQHSRCCGCGTRPTKLARRNFKGALSLFSHVLRGAKAKKLYIDRSRSARAVLAALQARSWPCQVSVPRAPATGPSGLLLRSTELSRYRPGVRNDRVLPSFLSPLPPRGRGPASVLKRSGSRDRVAPTEAP